jgi:hypothetical protein
VPIPIFTEPSSIRVETPKQAEQYATFQKFTKVTHPHRYGIGTRLTKAMEKGRNGIEIVDSREICHVALPKHDPDADILLEELLMEDVRNQILSQGIRFLVVLSPLRTMSIEEKFCGFWPCGTNIETTNLTSTIIDIKENAILDGFTITASGKGGMIYLVIMPYTDPTTEKSAIDTMAERIAERISEKTEGKPTRIMFVEKLTHHSETIISSARVQLELYYGAISQDKTKLAHLYLCSSADQGHPDARYRIGWLYENCAEGLSCSSIRALYWYRLAAKSQHYLGAVNAKRLTEASKPDELAEVERLIEAWEPGQCSRDLFPENPDVPFRL